MKRIFILPAIALVATCAAAQDAKPHRLGSTGGNFMPPSVRPAAARMTDPIPQPVRDSNPDAALIDAIETLSRRVDSLAITQMEHNEYPVSRSAGVGCGVETMSQSGCDSCAPQVVYTMPAPETVLTFSEPPEIRQQRQSCLQSRSVPRTTRTVMQSACGAVRSSSVSAFQWSVSLCDRLRGRGTVRQVGEYRVEVIPGLFSTEVTVTP